MTSRALKRAATQPGVAADHSLIGEGSQSQQKDYLDFLRVHYTILSEYYMAANIHLQFIINLDVAAAGVILVLANVLFPISHDAITSLWIAKGFDALLLFIGVFNYTQFIFATNRARFFSTKMDKLAAYLANPIYQDEKLIYFVNDEQDGQMKSPSQSNKKIVALINTIREKYGFDENTNPRKFIITNIFTKWPNWWIVFISVVNSLAFTFLIGLHLVGWEEMYTKKASAFEIFLDGLQALYNGFWPLIGAITAFCLSLWIQVAWEAHMRDVHDRKSEKIREYINKLERTSPQKGGEGSDTTQ